MWFLKNKDTQIVERLGYGRCRLPLPCQSPKTNQYSKSGRKKNSDQLSGDTKKWLQTKMGKINADIHVISGSVAEIGLVLVWQMPSAIW